jgi:hypothetical protein
MNTFTKKMVASPVLAALIVAAVGAGAGVVTLASAAEGTNPLAAATQSMMGGMKRGGPGVHGTIAAIAGTTITVTGDNGTTYTVDASTAKILKSSPGATPTAPVAGTIASLLVGDTVHVRGTVSGSAVTATEIFDGVMMGHKGGMGRGRGPGIMGTVSAVNGTTLTVAGKDGTTYTVETGSAKLSKVVDIATSDIKVGDTVGVQGTVSGTTVTAVHVMDGVPPSGKGAASTQ